MRRLFLLLIPLTLFLANCAVSTESLQHQDELKMEIAKSISVPFSDADTLVYNSINGYCGVEPKRALMRRYNPQLNTERHLEVLNERFSGTVIHYDLRNQEKTVELCGDMPLHKCLTKDKIKLDISGKTLSRRAVQINEVYTLNDETRAIVKRFTWRNNEWSYEILSDSKI